MHAQRSLAPSVTIKQSALPRTPYSVPHRRKMSSVAVSAAPAARPHDRVLNFSAGPAVLPIDVLEQAKTDMLSWQGSGVSVMEMSHRSKEFESILKQTEADLRTLLAIPSNYKVLFLQGGASTQFASLPLNFTKDGDTVDYLITGSWGKKAAEEAKKYCTVNVVAKGDNKSIPDATTWKLTPGAKFVHYCDNETIQGVEFKAVPEVGDVPLIADMSSNFVSKPVDVSKYAVIYAGAQKNVGPSGVTIVIIRDDMIGESRPITPTMLDYKTMADNGSMYNTPPCWAIYICGLVFARLLKLGGLEAMYKLNQEKAEVLYDTIAASGGFYNSPVDPACRSSMNVPFTIPSSPDLEKAFVKEAEAVGMVQLKGHRSVGGMRASIYNAMSLEAVKELAAFMKAFATKYSK